MLRVMHPGRRTTSASGRCGLNPGMDRGRCGLLVEARNAPWLSPEGCSGTWGAVPVHGATCAVTRSEKVVSRV